MSGIVVHFIPARTAEEVPTWHFVGPVNEDVQPELARILSALTDRCAFNLRQVDYVNSSGIRAWVGFLRQAKQKAKVTLLECSPAVVTQMNMVPSFADGTTVASVLAPYACDSCKYSTNVLYQKDEFPIDGKIPKDEICPRCGESMQMQETLFEYFIFASPDF